MQFIDSPRAIFETVRINFNPHAEELWVLGLNSHGLILGHQMIFRGTVDLCLSHPRDILRYVISLNSSSFAVAHNHPSGDPTPSARDIKMTKKIFKLGQLIEIPLLDHVIFTSDKFVSLQQQKLIPQAQTKKDLLLF